MRMSLLGFAAGLFIAGTASAATFDFDLIYDGTSLNYAVDSDSIDGTKMKIGEDFDLTVRAATGGSWFVNSEVVDAFQLLGLFTKTAAVRLGDIATALVSGGKTVFSTSETGVEQSPAHVGTETSSIAFGTVFDSFTVTYRLTGYGAGPLGTTTLVENGAGILASGAFSDPTSVNGKYFTYRTGAPSPVPLPASVLLLIAGLGGLAAMRRRRT